MEIQRVLPALLRSARLLVIAAVSAFLVAAALTALRPGGYETQSLVDVARLLDDDDAFSNAERADRTVANELVLAGDRQVAELASARLGGVDVEELADAVAVDQLTGTDNISFTAGARDPRTAARTATAYAEAYAEARLEQRRAAALAEAEGLARELADLQEQLEAAPDVGTSQSQFREQALRDQYAALVSREVELRTSVLADVDPARSVLPAPVPDAPAGLGPLQWGVLAAVLTLALGTVVVAVRSRSRDAVEFRADLQELGLPVLAEVRPRAQVRGASVDRDAEAALLDEAALGLTLAGPTPGLVAVLSPDGLDHGDFVRGLAKRLQEQGVHLVPVERATPGSRRSATTTLLDATAHTSDAERMRSADLADLVLLVVVRGVTRRSEVARTLEQLDRLSSSPRLAVLLDDQRRQQDGSPGGKLGRRTIQVRLRTGAA